MHEMTDSLIIRELGSRARQERLRRNLTQAIVADRAGIGTATLKRLEDGNDVSLSTMIAVLRVLGGIDALDAILPTPTISPLAAPGALKPQRQRSRPTTQQPSTGWVWGEDA